MGFREELTVDWEDKTIEYQGKKMYVVKVFTYNNVEYLCTVDLDTIHNENVEVAFLYKVKDSIFAHVDDDELLDKLVMTAGEKSLEDMIKEDVEKLKQEGKI